MTDSSSTEPIQDQRPVDPDPGQTVPVGPVSGTPDQPRVTVTRDPASTWPIIGLVGVLVVALVSALANAIPFNDLTTTEVINKYPIAYRPADWTFTIWGLVVVLFGVFVIYALLPAGRKNTRVGSASPFFLAMNAAIVAWFFLWHWEVFAPALGALIIAVVAVLMIYFAVRVHRRNTAGPSRFQRLILWTPFSLAAAWLTQMTLINLMVWWQDTGWRGPFSLTIWAILFIVGGVAAAALFGIGLKDPVVSLVFAWTWIGIAAEQGGDRWGVTIFAVIGAIAGAAIAVMAAMLEFDSQAMSRFRHRPAGPPPTPVHEVPHAREDQI